MICIADTAKISPWN